MSDDALADLTSHRIEGIARHGNRAFSVPLISEIDGNLWMGGCHNGATLPEQFRFVVSLYPWEAYRIRAGDALSIPTVLSVPLLDIGAMPDLALLDQVAEWAKWATTKGPTLVHCQAGLNRSGLVCALVLIKSGMLPADAISLLREKRCDAVLCNATFEEWLMSLGGNLRDIR